MECYILTSHKVVNVMRGDLLNENPMNYMHEDRADDLKRELCTV
jgi:hypothetical protein